MTTTTVQLRSISGTDAFMGWAGQHGLVIDRPLGEAGGLGLGFRGGQLLALALGGCFANSLQFAAHDANIHLRDVKIDVVMTYAGCPAAVSSAELRVSVSSSASCEEVDEVITHAYECWTVGQSIRRGISLTIVREREDLQNEIDLATKCGVNKTVHP